MAAIGGIRVKTLGFFLRIDNSVINAYRKGTLGLFFWMKCQKAWNLDYEWNIAVKLSAEKLCFDMVDKKTTVTEEKTTSLYLDNLENFKAQFYKTVLAVTGI